eukprot:4836295-Prymnesium_polylepis.2
MKRHRLILESPPAALHLRASTGSVRHTVEFAQEGVLFTRPASIKRVRNIENGSVRPEARRRAAVVGEV